MSNREDFESNWEYTKSLSNYHFDPKQIDAVGVTYTPLGRFTPTWEHELEIIKQHCSGPWTWRNRKIYYKTVEQEEHDLIQNGCRPDLELLHVFYQFHLTPNIKKVIDFFGIKGNGRVNIQYTGQVFNYHIDKLDDAWPNEDPNNIIKVIVMLTDWQFGQFYQYGTSTYEHWQAGDAHVFDWRNAPHGTANAGYHPRISLQVAGIKTQRTEAILRGEIKLP